MSLVQFKLIYPSGSGSVSISIEDGVPKPLLKSSQGLYEVDCLLARNRKYNYQIFLDDEPQQIQAMDTSLSNLTRKSDERPKESKSLYLVNMDAQDQPDLLEPVSKEDEYDHPPDLAQSDSETVTSETDTPLTPTRDCTFGSRMELQANLSASQDLKENDYDNPQISPNNLHDTDTVLVQTGRHATEIEPVPLPVNHQKNVLETYMSDEEDSDVQPLPTSTNEITFPESAAAEHETDDELEDRCIVDDMIEELRGKEKNAIWNQKASSTSKEIPTQTQSISKMTPAELLQLESMFASFIMLVIFQAVSSVFSFAKASLD
jgi:hypothetical protein